MTVDLRRFAWLSIAAAVSTMALKAVAWWLTGSVGLLSDAVESGVNLAGAFMALAMLSIAARPADSDHAFGHEKAEYFSSGFEGALILAAAVLIAWTAIDRLLTPQPLEALGLGLAISVVASVINGLVAAVLLRAGRAHRSITLEADARHLLTDVWTSAGILLGLLLVWLTGAFWLDPVVAMLVAVHIAWVGIQLLRRSVDGLMDKSLPEADLIALAAALTPFHAQGIATHQIRTRQAGRSSFISLHVLVPGHWSVRQGHDVLEQIEEALRDVVPGARVITHLEPIEDPRAYEAPTPLASSGTRL